MNKKTIKRRTGFILKSIQHIAIVTAAVMILMVLTGSTVLMKGVDGNYSYTLDMSEKEKVFEESLLFNYILGRGTADVARMAAVQGQMETDGVFDGQKEIDVATFYYRYDRLPDRYITVKYRLEDLIKWAQYGFESENYWMSGEDVDEFLSRTSTYTELDYSTGNVRSGVISPYNTNLDEITEEVSVSANAVMDGEFKRDDTNASIIKNRYQTVDGKNIEEYTGTWEEYDQLCSMIQSVAKDLFKNYQEYMTYKEFYDIKNSNLRFYIVKDLGERQEIYTNLSDREGAIAKSDKQRNSLFQSYGKYLYFEPSNMKYETNTLITEETVRHLFNAYEYAYPETIRVWIGVDTKLPVSDVYTQGKTGMEQYFPYYWQLLGAAGAALILYLLLFVYLTVMEGRMRKEEDGTIQIQLKKWDRIPTELMVLLAIGVTTGIIIALTYVFDSMSFEYYYKGWFKIGAAAVVFVCELLFTFFYYSFVRRVKGDSLWTDSLTCKGTQKGKALALQLYDNGSLIMKTWIPYVIFVAGNLLLSCLGLAGVLSAIALDLAIGILLYQNARIRKEIIFNIEKIKEGDFQSKVEEDQLHGDNKVLAQAVNSIGEGIRIAVETSMKDERLKADLITNVSHDIKTPLTSIINYVDLIRRENIENEKVKGYIEVLDSKSQRLKQLTDDLVEASKISSGNIALELEKINLVELVNQTLGEFSEKFEQKRLVPILNNGIGSVAIEADSRRMWRVVENLFNNIFKYAMEGTRVYLEMSELEEADAKSYVVFSIKNISAQPLNMDARDLTERFIRGDVARSTEGSGLGLSIAKNLTEAQRGCFDIQLDGDLFKVILTFPLLKE